MNSRTNESPSYQLFMLALCAYTLLVLTFEVLLQPEGETRQLLEYADTGVCVLFLLDFLICLYRSPNRWHYLRTWGWLDLLSSIPTIGLARWGRAARAARIVRVLRGVRATKILGALILARRTESTFLAAGLGALLLIVTASISILHVETADDANIKTAGDALWWAMSTITTVGYGDRYPVTTEGRFVAALLMCAGVGLFGTLSGFLAAWFVTPAAQAAAHATADLEKHEIEALRGEIQELRSLLERSLVNQSARLP
jgi:voltage-gated potassium channel